MNSFLRFSILTILFNLIKAEYDIIIIGAGPAGIAAAIELKKYKPNIVMKILEARNRIGGRAVTDNYTFNRGVSVDLGAEWIHAYGPNNPIFDWHQRLQTDEDEAGDKLFEFFEPSVTGCFDVNGSDICPQTCRQAQDVMTKLFSPSYDLHGKSDISVRQVISTGYQKLPDGTIKRLVDAMLIGREEYEATDLENLSARQTLFIDSSGDDEEENGDDMALIHGYGSLVSRIAQASNIAVTLNAVVKHINTTNPDHVDVTTVDRQTFRSKAVLITVPLGCLKKRTIAFQPVLPRWKLEAIDAMGFGDTDKIILQFDRVFWNPKLTTFYIAGSPYPFAICAPDKQMLVFMIGGTRARNMESKDDKTVIEIVMRNLKSAFPRENFRLQKFKITRWSQDPFVGGSYSYYKVNSNIETRNDLARECSNNRLFWAGEHTTTGGSVHNAFATGQREARNIIKHFL